MTAKPPLFSARKSSLPLRNPQADRSLMAMILLMTFVILMVGASSVYFGRLAGGWEAKLSEIATIEIDDSKFSLKLQKELESFLDEQEIVSSYEIVPPQEVMNAVSPWLDIEGLEKTDIPLPVIINLSLQSTNTLEVEKLAFSLKAISQDINFQSHQNWLSDALKWANLIRLLSIAIACALLAVLVLALSLLVRDRVVLNRDVIDLLHVMGATDHYILKEFLWHLLAVALKALILGIVFYLAVSGLLYSFLMPDNDGTEMFSSMFSLSDPYILLAIPLLVFTFVTITVWRTVIKAVRALP